MNYYYLECPNLVLKMLEVWHHKLLTPSLLDPLFQCFKKNFDTNHDSIGTRYVQFKAHLLFF